MNKEEITEAYINIATMFGTKPTKELIKSIPKKDLVNVCYSLYETIEEQEKLNEEHQKLNGELREELRILKHNWDELKRYVVSETNFYSGCNDFSLGKKIVTKEILDVINKIESGDIDE